MIKKIKSIFFATTATVLVLPAVVLADYGVVNPGGLPEQENFNQILLDIINWILTFLASLAILMIVVSGIMYMTSGGDQQRVDTAKKMLTYSIAGLVVALLSYMIVKTVGSMLGAAQ